jgi:hypothetical protein
LIVDLLGALEGNLTQGFGKAFRLSWCLLALGQALSVSPPEPLAGQSSTIVEPVQGLRFDHLEAGGERIPVTDPGRRAEWLVRGQGTVEILTVLPENLTHGRGSGEISLEFGYGDMAYVLPGSSEPILVNPSHPLLLTLPDNGLPVRILLGGKARSTGEEIAGDYGAPVTLLVSQARVSS